MKYDISVIIPAYQAEKYIRQSIESIIAQNGDIKIEIIVIDDNSSDTTVQAVKDTMAAYPDWKIVLLENQSNMGASGSRNRGIQVATGDYVAFLDADDYWRDDKLLKQMELMENHDVRFVYSARSLVSDEGEIVKGIIPVPEQLEFATLLHSNAIPCGSVIVAKELLPEPAFVRDDLHEDYILWLRILKTGVIAYGINEPLLFSRLSPGGKSRNKLKSAKMNFGVYRYFGLPLLKSIMLMISYTINGVLKYR